MENQELAELSFTLEVYCKTVSNLPFESFGFDNIILGDYNLFSKGFIKMVSSNGEGNGGGRGNGMLSMGVGQHVGKIRGRIFSQEGGNDEEAIGHGEEFNCLTLCQVDQRNCQVEIN